MSTTKGKLPECFDLPIIKAETLFGWLQKSKDGERLRVIKTGGTVWLHNERTNEIYLVTEDE